MKAASAKEKLWEVLDICLRDHRQAWTLDEAGHYTRLTPESDGNGPENAGTHQVLTRLAMERHGD